MDFAELTRTRRTVGAFTADKIDDGWIRDAFGLSLWAPNHRLTYPMRYWSLGPTTRAGLADLALGLKAAKGPVTEAARTGLFEAITKPSHVIALGLNRSADPVVAHEDYATLACAVQIATTALWARGVATKWSTAGWTMNARTYAILGVDPDQVRLEGALIVGRAARTPTAPARPALDDVFAVTV